MAQTIRPVSTEGSREKFSSPQVDFVCVLLIGRGSRGKSFFARMLHEYLASKPIPPAKKLLVVDGDRTNPTTSTHIPDAIRPEHADEVSYREWVRDMLCMAQDKQAHVIIDLGAAADNAIKQIVYELDLVSFFQRQQVQFVLVHCIGPDLADLAYIDAFEADLSGPESRKVLAPTATIVAVNAGVARGSGDPRKDFEAILSDQRITNVKERGARILTIPFLRQMRRIEEGNHTIARAVDAARHDDDSLHLNAIDQFEVMEWWKALTKQFATLSATGWLP